MNLFNKVRMNATAYGAAVDYKFGKTIGMGARGIGLLQLASENPIKTTALALAISSSLDYGSRAQQSIPAGPAQNSNRPTSLSDSKYDLGASGDLVFALHRLG